MNPTVSVFLDTRDEPKKNGKYPLKLRVTVGEKSNRSRGIGFDFTEKEFTKLKNNQLKHPYKDIWNQIAALITKGDKIVEELMPFFTFKDFWERFFDTRKSFVIEVEKTSLNYALKMAIELYLKKGQYPMSVKVAESVRSILKYTKTENLPLRSITPEFCRKYEDYMFSKSHKFSRNGAGINLRHIRILFNYAISKNLVPKKWYPFKRKSGEASEFDDAYVIPNERKVKQFLNQEELIAFSGANEFNTESQKKAHIAFLISFHCNGANAADFLSFTFNHIQGDFIIFYREKVKNATRGDRKPVKVFLSEDLKQIIKEFGNPPSSNNYIFPVLKHGMSEEEIYKTRRLFNMACSRSLKYVAKHLGIQKNVTMANARHTLANLLKKNKVDREFVKDLFGHTSIVTADNYYEQFEDSQQKEIMNNIIFLSKKIA
jgi:integrase/recombinase XerD